MRSIGEVHASCTHFGLVTACRFEYECGEQIVLLRIGATMQAYLPFEQAVALRADLNEVLAPYDRATAASERRSA